MRNTIHLTFFNFHDFGFAELNRIFAAVRTIPMLVKTEAIVLHAFKYGETRMIVDLFTRESGRLSFIVPLPKTAKSRLKKQYFQPMTLLEVECDLRQRVQLQKLKDAQKELQKTMQDYAVWSTGVLNTVREQNEGSINTAGRIAGQMDASAKELSDTYTSFVKDITGGFSRALGMFDENIHSVLSAMNEKLDDLKTISGSMPDQAAQYRQETENCITAISQLQRALTGMTAAIGKTDPTEAD